MPNAHTPTHATHAAHATAADRREAAVRQEADKKRVTRMDPQELQRQATIERAKADPTAPKPQVGLSSSQLNTATPAMKDAATKEARALPSNTSPEKAPTERQAATAEKKFQKEHEA